MQSWKETLQAMQVMQAVQAPSQQEGVLGVLVFRLQSHAAMLQCSHAAVLNQRKCKIKT